MITRFTVRYVPTDVWVGGLSEFYDDNKDNGWIMNEDGHVCYDYVGEIWLNKGDMIDVGTVGAIIFDKMLILSDTTKMIEYILEF